MDIDEYLRLEVSKAHTRRIAGMVQQKPELLHQLWEIAMSTKEPVNWRAAWVIKGIWEEQPELIEPLLGNMRRALPKLKKRRCKTRVSSDSHRIPPSG